MKYITKYNAAPNTERFYEASSAELAEIIREIRMLDDNRDDLGDAVRAAKLQDSEGRRVFVARDEDGYYFATEERFPVERGEDNT